MCWTPTLGKPNRPMISLKSTGPQRINLLTFQHCDYIGQHMSRPSHFQVHRNWTLTRRRHEKMLGRPADQMLACTVLDHRSSMWHTPRHELLEPQQMDTTKVGQWDCGSKADAMSSLKVTTPIYSIHFISLCDQWKINNMFGNVVSQHHTFQVSIMISKRQRSSSLYTWPARHRATSSASGRPVTMLDQTGSWANKT